MRGALCACLIAFIPTWFARAGGLKERATFYGEPGFVSSIAFSPDSTLLAVADPKRDIVLWEIASGKPRHVLREQSGAAGRLSFSEQGKVLLSARGRLDGDGKWISVVGYWEVKTGKKFHSEIIEGAGANLALSAKHELLVTVQGYPNKIGKVWNLAAGREEAALEADPQHCACASICPMTKRVATAGNVGHVKLWDLKKDKPIAEFKAEKSIDFLSFSADGKLLVFRTPKDRTFRFWDVAAGKELSTKIKYAQNGGALSPDNTLFAVARSNLDALEDPKAEKGMVLDLVSVRTGKVLAKLKVSTRDRVNPVVFSPDGRLLAAACGTKDGAIRIWDVPKLEH